MREVLLRQDIPVPTGIKNEEFIDVLLLLL